MELCFVHRPEQSLPHQTAATVEQKEKDSFPACCAEADAWSSGPEVGGLDWNVLADPWAVSMQVLVAMVGNAICAICMDGTSILAYINANCGGGRRENN
ncbi:hypothetical protein STEG23_013920 [Scotinomys teguina]